jgi:regulatory protein
MRTRRNPEQQQKLNAYARELRSLQTDAGSRLWHLLRDRRFFGHKFRRQHAVEDFILDFYCADQHLAIELDGGQHANQRAYDEKREPILAALGIRVVRFWNNDLLQQTEAVLQAIFDVLEQAPAAPHPQPLSPLAGRGESTSPHPGPPPVHGEREKAWTAGGEFHPSPHFMGRGAGVEAKTLRDRALAHLARRDHTRLELARKLQHAGHAKEDIEPLLDELAQRGWLSNQRYAEAYVQQKQQRFGALKLAHEMRSRGVEESDLQQALTAAKDTELERARQVWEKRFGELPASAQQKARQMRFLHGRGFAPEIIRRILNATADELD